MIERGIIRSTTNVKADKRFIRPGLTKHIPVDSSGNVLSPLDSGYVNEFSFVTQKGKRFKFGDHTPAETAWRRSSEYPFALIKAIMLNRPAKVLGVGFDRSRVCRDYTNQLAYKADVTRRIKLFNLKFPATVDANNKNILATGLVNYIYNYMASDNLQNTIILSELINLKQKISFKLGGFADKDKLKLVLDSKNPTTKEMYLQSLKIIK